MILSIIPFYVKLLMQLLNQQIIVITPMPTICVGNRLVVHTVTQVENAIKAIFQVSRCVLLLGMILQKMKQTGWKLCPTSFSDS